MNETKYSYSNPEVSLNAPYKDLYIYYIEGHLSPDHKIFYKDFIGNWEEDEFSFLFFSSPSKEKIKYLLSAQPHLTLLDSYHMTYDDWQGGTPTPFRAGRFLIIPPWEKRWNDSDADREELQILLDPGVVFGTGTHATTHDCLEALELAFWSEKPVSVLDLGTGTGLLALAASRLGCKKIVAVDLNLLAARTAENNVQLNNVKDSVVVIQGPAEDFMDIPADLVIANIHFDVMKYLINSEGFISKKWFILSGLLRSQARDVAYMLAQKRVKILKKWESEGIWHTFLGKIC